MDFEKTIKELESLLPFYSKIGSWCGDDKYKIQSVTSREKAENGIKNFDSIFHDLLECSRFSDKQLYQSIESINSKYDLVHIIGEINACYEVNMSLKDLKLQTIISAISGVSRLISLTKRLEKRHKTKFISDDEIFKPSNINIEQVTIYIENAITEIQDHAVIPPGQKKQLLQYLAEIKTDLAKEKKPWRKILGGLLVVSALLGGVGGLVSGVASAPKAYEHVKSAVNHIIGASVEKLVPLSLPPRTMAREEGLIEVG